MSVDAHAPRPTIGLDCAALDRAIARFERACWNGPWPRIEEYLLEFPDAEKTALLRELVHIDLELRWTTGRGASADEYLTRFPELFSDPEFKNELLAAELALRHGRPTADGGKEGSSVDAGCPDAEETMIAGRYRLLRPLGEGGMGTVYLAEQIQPVKRQVAVKLMKASLDSRQLLSRFEAERQALALMDHPFIAKLLDAGATGAGDRAPEPAATTSDPPRPAGSGREPYGRLFFVMELVDGVPITEFCDRRQLGVEQRLALFNQVCAAVHHAHTKGIIHRDLKPSNILVEGDARTAVPKVIDFGLAKALGDIRLSEQTLVTALGTVAGTPLYMAPEQATFRAVDIDTRADIHALGVVLYELLTGTTPIQKECLTQVALDELLGLIREQDPPPPSQRLSAVESLPAIAAARQMEPSRLVRVVRGDLDWIVMKALAKDRERRYETANDLARDIQRFLDGDPVSAGPPSAAYRVRKLARKHRAALATAGAFALTLLTATGVSTGLALWANQERLRAIGAETLAIEQRRRAEQREQHAIDAVKRFRDAVVNEPILKDSAELVELRKKLLAEPLALVKSLYEELRSTGDARPESLAQLAQAALDLGALTSEIGEKEDALRATEEAQAIWGRLVQEQPSVIDHQDRYATSCNSAGNLQRELGHLPAALESHQKALAIQERLAREHPEVPEYRRNLAGSHHNIGLLQVALGRLEAARESYGKALAIREQLAREHPEDLIYQRELGTSYNNLGAFQHMDQKQPKPALETYGKALAIRERLAQADPELAGLQGELATTRMNLANLQAALGQREAALESYVQAIAIQRRLTEEHASTVSFQRDLARSYNNLGVLQSDMGRRDEALESYRQTLKVLERLAREHPEVTSYHLYLAGCYNNMGNLQQAMGRTEGAIEAYENAAAVIENLARKQPGAVELQDTLAKVHHNVGVLQEAAGQLDKSLESFGRARSVWEQLAGEHPETHDFASKTGDVLSKSALVHQKKQQLDAARAALEQAIDWQQKALAADPDNPTYQQRLRDFTQGLMAISDDPRDGQ